MALALRSLHDLPSPNGVIDRRYPSGDAPIINPSILAINAVLFATSKPNLLSLTANQSFDFNYRQFLTGSSASTAVITVNSASGSLGNWVVDASGNGISINTGALANSGSLFVSASNGSITVSFPVQSWSTLPVGSSGTIKLPVGNGFWTDNQYWYSASGGTGQEQSNFTNYFPTWSASPYVKYFFMSLTWGACEGPTRGDYSKAFAAIDAVLAKCATAAHKMGVVVHLWMSFFNTLSTTSLTNWPQYVVNNNWVAAGVRNGQQRTQPKWDIDDLWSAYNGLCTAILDRYNSHPLFFGFGSMDETDAITVLDNGTTIANGVHYQQKLQEQALLLKDHAPNTLIYVPFNWMPPGDAAATVFMGTMIQALLAKSPFGYVMGGPDPFQRQTTFQKMIAGGLQAQTGIGDIRKNILIMNRVEEAYLGNQGNPPTNPGVTPGQIYDLAVQNNAVMLTWNHQTWEFYKYADEIAAIQARNGAVGTPPAGGSYTII